MAGASVDRNEVLARIDLEALADELLGPHKGRGRSKSWPCPAVGHGAQTGKTPPLTVFTSRSGTPRYRCHGCGEGGTAIDLVMATQGMSVGDALRYLADRAGLVPDRPWQSEPAVARRLSTTRQAPARPAVAPPAVPDPRGRDALTAYVSACERLLWARQGEGVRRWLYGRGLGADILRANRVGADPGPRLLPRQKGLPRGGLAAVFPVLDGERRPTYLQARYLDPGGVGRRYDNPAERLAGPNPKMAAVHLVRRPRGRGVVVCEGLPDALTAAEHGLRAVAVLGVGVPDAELAASLAAAHSAEPLVVAFDADTNQAGQRGARRLGELLVAAGVGDRVGVLDVPAPHNDLNAWAVAAGAGFEAELAAAWQRVRPFEPAMDRPTAAEVRAAAEALVSWQGGNPHPSDPPADALAVLRSVPTLPGRFGEAVADIVARDPGEWGEPLVRLRASLGHGAPGAGGTLPGQVAGIAAARDAALDRALEASLRPGGADPTGARAWCEVHDRAVAGLAAAGAPGARPPPIADRGAGPPWVPERGGLDWDR